MEKNELIIMAEYLISKIKLFFGDKVDEFQVSDVYSIPGHESFNVYFTAYNFYYIRVSYDIGILGCCIINGNNAAMEIESSQKRWKTVNYDVFLQEMQEELELRIPDKFLKKKGWLK